MQHTTHAFQLWDVSTGIRLGTLDFQYGATRWFFLAADGRYDGTDDILPVIDLRVKGNIYPITTFDRAFYTPGLLAAFLEGKRPPISARLKTLPVR